MLNVFKEDYSRLISNLLKMIRWFQNTSHEGLVVERQIYSYIMKGRRIVLIIRHYLFQLKSTSHVQFEKYRISKYLTYLFHHFLMSSICHLIEVQFAVRQLKAVRRAMIMNIDTREFILLCQKLKKASVLCFCWTKT